METAEMADSTFNVAHALPLSHALLGKPATFQQGLSLIEVLVALIVTVLGLLGVLGLQMRSQQSEYESYQRAQALILLSDMVNRVQTNRLAARCYDLPGPVGAGESAPIACSGWGTASTRDRADADLTEWHDLLRGTAEQVGADNVGAMVGARGCVTYDTASDTYTATVVWQGKFAISASASTCAQNRYGNEALRRVVSQTFRLATLN
jgi:type IV pilus assembly protein PilV